MRRKAVLSLLLLVATMGIGMTMNMPKAAAHMAASHHHSGTFPKWYEDSSGYKHALAVQKKDHLPIFLYIYASWCPHCKKFSSTVLASGQVKKFLRNYPHVRVAPDNGAAEKKIMAEYGPEGYPAFYVVYPDQRHVQVDTFVTQPKPREKTPKEFLKSLSDIVEK